MSFGETSEYVRIGAYIGQVISPVAAVISGFPRLPAIVAKGSRLARYRNSEIVRAKVEDETLTFTGAGPYTAPLNYQADGIKANTVLVADGVVQLEDRYLFTTTIEANDTITIPTQYYDATATYVITYQSVDRDVLDPLPFQDLRNIERMGRSVDSSTYTEFTDFIVPVTVGSVTSDAGNGHLTGEAAGATAYATEIETDGTIAGFDAFARLAGPTTVENDLILRMTADLDGSAVTVTTVAGGTEGIVENTSTRVVTITYVTATSTVDTLIATINTAASGLTLVESAGRVPPGGIFVASTWSTPAQDQTVYATQVDPDVGNSANLGAVALSPNSSYSHPYDRSYQIEVVTTGDITTAEFIWSSTPISGGNTSTHHNPHPSLVSDANFQNLITGLSANDEDVVLEYGIQVRFNDLSDQFTSGDIFTFVARGPGLIEMDGRHSNTNQFAEFTTPVETYDAGTLGVLSISSDISDYTGTYNRRYKVVVSAVVASTSAALRWTAVGDDGIASGSNLTVTDGGTLTLDEGVTVDMDISAGDMTVGDTFTFEVNAARVIPNIKDDRTYTAEVSTAVANNVAFVYFTDTPEGGIGSFTATAADSAIEFDGNLTAHVRNIALPRYDASDEFTWSLALDDVVDWSLIRRVSETIEAGDIIHDMLGRVTGTPDTYYAILNNAPSSLVSVLDGSSNSVATTIVTSGSENTRYISFGSTDPGVDLTVTYEFRGLEPEPGDTYRLTALYLRGDELYNTPILVTSEADGLALVEPLGTANHLGMGHSITWGSYDPVGVYYVQVKDADDDGVYQDSDYETAISGTEGTTDITDLVVLDAWGTMGAQLTHLDTMADPLVGQPRLGWFGAPRNTAVGDVNTTGSLIQTARETLAVYGASPAHGTRILVAPTTCNFTVVFTDGSPNADVDLDGSFVALAMCMQYASFSNPSQTALERNLTAFNTIETFSEEEIKQLGAAQINFLDFIGNGIYEWKEDVTTDATGTANAPDEFRIISAMTQKVYINRRLQAAINAAVISLVPDSPEAGLEVLRNTCVNVIRQDIDDKNIAEYQNDDGSVRRMLPNQDIIVYRDRTRSTVYRFFVGYFLKYPVKRVFGLALTDSNNFGSNIS